MSAVVLYDVDKSGGSVLRLLKNFFGLGVLSPSGGATFSFSERGKPLIVRIEVKEVMPHLPTVAADLAADGLFVFSLKRLSK